MCICSLFNVLSLALHPKGLADFTAPDYLAPLLYFRSTGVNLLWIFDDVQIICATKYKQDPLCKVVGTTVEAKHFPKGVKTSYRCNMFDDGKFGPGAHYSTDPPLNYAPSVVLTKKTVQKYVDDCKGCDVNLGKTDVDGTKVDNN